MLCLDSSVVCKLFGTEDDSEKMLMVIDLAMDDKIELIASDLVVFELGNFFWKASRKGKPLLKGSMQNIYSLNIEFFPITSELAEIALVLAKDLDLTFYDAVHVTLAREHSCPLVTEDNEILAECDDALSLDEAIETIEDQLFCAMNADNPSLHSS